MNKLIKVAVAAAAVAALGGLSTAAYAADPVALPEGDSIYQANYSEDPAALWTTADDGTATVIGTPTTSGLRDVTDGAWDPTTNRSYVVGNGYSGPCELWEANVVTGQFTFVAFITGDDGATRNCDAFDIAPDGTAWITMYSTSTSLTLAKLDLGDGSTTDPVTASGYTNYLSWIAVEPSSGVMWAGNWNDDLYSIDVSTGAATFIDTVSAGGAHDAAFDSSGRLWITGWRDTTELYSTLVADYVDSYVYQGPILIDSSGEQTGTDSIWIVRGAASTPAPVLAATGIDSSAAVAGGIVALVLGLGLVALRRARRA